MNKKLIIAFLASTMLLGACNKDSVSNTTTILGFESYDEVIHSITRLNNNFGRAAVVETPYHTEGSHALEIVPQGNYTIPNAAPEMIISFINSGATTSNFNGFKNVDFDIYNTATKEIKIGVSYKFTSYASGDIYTDEVLFNLKENSWNVCSFDLDAVAKDFDLSYASEMRVVFYDFKKSKDDKISALYMDNLRGTAIESARSEYGVIQINRNFGSTNRFLLEGQEYYRFDLSTINAFIGNSKSTYGPTDGITYQLFKGEGINGELLLANATSTYDFKEGTYTLLLTDTKGRAEPREVYFDVYELSTRESIDFSHVSDISLFSAADSYINVKGDEDKYLEVSRRGSYTYLKVDYDMDSYELGSRLTFDMSLTPNGAEGQFAYWVLGDGLWESDELVATGVTSGLDFSTNVKITLTNLYDYVSIVVSFAWGTGAINYNDCVMNLDNFKMIEPLTNLSIVDDPYDFENNYDLSNYFIDDQGGSAIDANYVNEDIPQLSDGGERLIKYVIPKNNVYPAYYLYFGHEIPVGSIVQFSMYIDKDSSDAKTINRIEGYPSKDNRAGKMGHQLFDVSDYGKWIDVSIELKRSSDQMWGFIGFEGDVNNLGEVVYFDNFHVTLPTKRLFLNETYNSSFVSINSETDVEFDIGDLEAYVGYPESTYAQRKTGIDTFIYQGRDVSGTPIEIVENIATLKTSSTYCIKIHDTLEEVDDKYVYLEVLKAEDAVTNEFKFNTFGEVSAFTTDNFSKLDVVNVSGDYKLKVTNIGQVTDFTITFTSNLLLKNKQVSFDISFIAEEETELAFWVLGDASWSKEYLAYGTTSKYAATKTITLSSNCACLQFYFQSRKLGTTTKEYHDFAVLLDNIKIY